MSFLSIPSFPPVLSIEFHVGFFEGHKGSVVKNFHETLITLLLQTTLGGMNVGCMHRFMIMQNDKVYSY
jgi:hypothetical protein